MLGPFDWQDFLRFARTASAAVHMKPPAEGQAERRSAISRAYYYAFHVAKNRAVVKGWTPTKSDTHIKLIDWIRALGIANRDRLLQDIADDLKTLRDLRNLADYDASATFASIQAQTAIDDANDLARRIIAKL